MPTQWFRLFIAFSGLLAWMPAATARAQADSEASPRWILPEVTAPGVQRGIFSSSAAQTNTSYYIYLPDAYKTDPLACFPVLYWLHGTGGGMRAVPILAEWFDAAIRRGDLPPMLVVFPNGLPQTMWCDSVNGKTPIETILIRELIPHIDRTFRTITSRKGRIVEGFSMGGYGAARLGFKYPDLFGGVSLLGAGPLDLGFEGPRASANPEEREQILQNIFGGSLETFRTNSPWTLAKNAGLNSSPDLRIRQVVGMRDGSLAGNRSFHDRLNTLNVPHDYIELPDVSHQTMQVLTGLGAENWEFYRSVFGETVPQSSTSPAKVRLLASGKPMSPDPEKKQ
ncbi:alpha/beta hydrolase [Pontiella sp.]|uniref:alpha/beta hydrolase n=1 Tax=Pontiella sp. TaxID=2837462 RepID=UPI003568502B